MKQYALQGQVNGEWITLAIYRTPAQAESDRARYAPDYGKATRIVPICR